MSQRAFTLTVLTMALVLPVGEPLSAAEPAVPDSLSEPVVASSREIEALLVPIREKYKVPALVAGIVHGDRLTAAGATGVRKLGSPEPITQADKLHFGSDTKAMTATQLALLVEQSELSWQTTIVEIFPDLKADLHAEFQAVNLAQLLTHRAGLPANGPWESLGKGSLVEQPWTKGPALTHSGSNTFWYATVWIAPARNAAYLAAANQGGEAAQLACNDAIVALIGNDEQSAARAATGDKENKSPEKATVEIHKTSGGVRFGVLGLKPAAPAPTLFVFAHELAGTLTDDDYNKVGRLLRKQGVLCVALDLPCHGQDVRPDEPGGLDGWAARLRKDEDPVGGFTKQASAVLDHLIAEGYTDREKIAVCGTSRGGFMAVHFAAAERRVRCVAAFAPVTELSALREFSGMEKHAGTTALDLRRQADKLAGRPIWMCIGNLDERVDTDRAIAFSRAAVKASVEAKKRPLVEVHVMTSVGHTIHPTAHDEAAAWIAVQLK